MMVNAFVSCLLSFPFLLNMVCCSDNYFGFAFATTAYTKHARASNGALEVKPAKFARTRETKAMIILGGNTSYTANCYI
jgi:hypothetical protein